MYRGDEARKRANAEAEAIERRREARRKQASGPMRLYLKPGQQREVIIVDEAPDFHMYEHQIYQGKGSNPRYIHTGCVKEYETCPACESDQDSSFNLYLTVIDLEEYTNKNGEVVEFSKKLMVVKSGQQKKFTRRYKKQGSLRGQVVLLSRDGDKEPVIGGDIEWDDFVDEDELSTAYIREWVDKKGERHVENCGEPYDYEELFEEPTVEGILEALGGSAEAPAGSREEARRTAAQVDEEEDDDDDGWEGDDGPENVEYAKDGDEDEGEDEDDDESEDGEDEDEEEDAPRRSARTRSSKTAPRSSKKSTPKPAPRSEGRKRRRIG